MIPKFCNAVQISRFCSVTARFCSNFHHTLTISYCTFCRKIGPEESVLQEYVTDILKMCLKKFNAVKMIFDKFTAF